MTEPTDTLTTVPLYTGVVEWLTGTVVPYDNTTELFNGTMVLVNDTVFLSNDTDGDTNGSSSMIGSSLAASVPLPVFPSTMLGITSACAFIIAILGTVGNLLTIIALPMNKKLRTTNTAFVVNLAVVELCYCVVILPMNGVQFAYMQYNGYSPISDFDCVFIAVARYTFTQADLQTIIGIAVFRAVAVGCPTLYQKFNNMNITVVYITCIWLYSFLIKVPTGMGVFGRYVFNNRTLKCDFAMEAASAKARVIALITEAFIPVLVIIILYTFIFIMVRRSSYRVTQMSIKLSKNSARPSISSSTDVPVSSTPAEEGSESGTPRRRGSSASFQNIKRMASDVNSRLRLTRRSSSITHCIATNRRDMRVARSIFIIFVVLLLCSVPVAVNHGFDTEVMHPTRLLVFHILYWLQYCLNSIIYVFMNRQYRDAYVDFLAKFLPYWKRHQGFTFPWELPSTSHPPTHLNGSIRKKPEKDSTSRDPRGKEPKLSEMGNGAKQHRLSAIVEANSSNLSDDDVFAKNGVEKVVDKKEEEGMVKKIDEEGTEEEKELWLNKNGKLEKEACDGDVV